jgi:hypothetical protein
MEIALVYPHQLFPDNLLITDGRVPYVVEDPLFFGTDSEQPLRFHAKKLLLHRASMQHYAKSLTGCVYVELPDAPCDLLSRSRRLPLGTTVATLLCPTQNRLRNHALSPIFDA